MYKYTSEYCSTYDVRQRVAKKTGYENFTLVSVPVVGIPFDKVAIDLVGPKEFERKSLHTCID